MPKQYDPAKPACLYVNQDGIQYRAPEVFDRADPQERDADRDRRVHHARTGQSDFKHSARSLQSQSRIRRLGRRLRTVLAGRAAPRSRDENHIGRTDDPSCRAEGNDRAIGGASSGAICAFTAAWERPDSFRRVFSAIGTYVGLRGGNVYPTLIRKFEPKPIRVFLQDGSADLNIYGGDWWMANQEMERALTFAG